jgi:hypothetical protein
MTFSENFTNRTPNGVGKYVVTGQDGLYEYFEIHQTTLVTDGDDQYTITPNLPANSVVTGVLFKVDTAITMTTGTSVAIGVTGNLDAICEVAVTSLDADGDFLPVLSLDPQAEALTGGDTQSLTTAQTLLMSITNGSATKSGDFDAGEWHTVIKGVRVKDPGLKN